METEGDVATAFTLARILTNVPQSRGGPASLVIFDIHALQVSCSGRCCTAVTYCDNGDVHEFLLLGYITVPRGIAFV